MSRPEAWRASRSVYPFGHTTETRFQDLDPLGHINNVAMAALFETGRMHFNRSIGMHRAPAGVRWLIARVDINYLAEAHFPDAVEIATGIGDIRRSSWTVLGAAFQNGGCVATCDCVLVMTDGSGAAALPEEFRAVLARNGVVRP